MKLWVKIGLFLSSYLPLFLILAIKNWFDSRMVLILIFVSMYSLVWIIIINNSKEGTSESYRVIKAKDKSHESLNYIIPYIISFIGFDLNKWQDWSALGILLLMLFMIYLNSELLYINPMLSLFNYRIYSVKVCKPVIGCEETVSEILLISNKDRIKKNEDITIKDIDGNVMLEVN